MVWFSVVAFSAAAVWALFGVSLEFPLLGVQRVANDAWVALPLLSLSVVSAFVMSSAKLRNRQRLTFISGVFVTLAFIGFFYFPFGAHPVMGIIGANLYWNNHEA